MKAIQESASAQALNQGPCSPREAAGLTGGALGPPPLCGREPLRHGPPQFHPASGSVRLTNLRLWPKSWLQGVPSQWSREGIRADRG